MRKESIVKKIVLEIIVTESHVVGSYVWDYPCDVLDAFGHVSRCGRCILLCLFCTFFTSATTFKFK